MLSHLTPEQARAVCHPQGPLLVLAGAGAGKTRVLCHRLAWLIDEGAAPSEVLALTFTRQAAEELRHRAEALLGRSHETLRVTTFHSWAQDLVRVHGVEHGLAPMVRQVDTERRKLIVLGRLGELDLQLTTGHRDAVQIVDEIIGRIDRCRDELVDAGAYLGWAREAVASAGDRRSEREARRELEFAQAFVAHDRWLADEGVEDFGMSLVRALDLMRRHADRCDAVRTASRHLLVDEFQDTNHAQAALLYTVAHPEGSVAVVGDDDQGIYRFRGASTKNIADFRARFPGAAEVRLERNYRSSQVILDAAWAVVAKVPDRVDKRLTAQTSASAVTPRVWCAPDPAGQARAVAEEILRQAEAGVPYEEQAVLMRAVRTEAPTIVAELERAGIPHQVRGGLGLMDRREVRTAIAWLRAVSDPTDAQAHLRIAAERRLETPWDVVADVAAAAHGAPLRTRLLAALEEAEAPRLGRLLDELGRLAATEPVPAVLRAVLDTTGLRAEAIAIGGAEGDARLAGLAGLERLVAALAEEDPQAGVSDVAGMLWSLAGLGYRGSGDTPAERRGVQVMTVHQSKGLEFDAVYLVGLTRANWPGSDRGRTDIPDPLLPEALPRDPDAHVAEARRLTYVAMTRARHTLVLAFCAVSAYGVAQRMSSFVEDVMAEVPAIRLEEVGAAPAEGLLDRVGEARHALEEATLDAARAAAEGRPAEAEHARAAAAVTALIEARAAAFAPHVPAPPPPAPAPAAPAQVRCSVSALARYWRCPLQYRYAHVDRIPVIGEDPLRELGTATHAVLEKAFPADGPPLEPDATLRLLEQRFRAVGLAGAAPARQALAQAAETMPKLRQRMQVRGATVVRTEAPFTLRVGPHTVVGRIDRIDALPGGHHRLVDYKTGARPTAEKARTEGATVMRIYMKGAHDALGVYAREATLEYVFEDERATDEPDAQEMQDAMDHTRHTLDAIAGGAFAPTPGWVCRSCDFRLLCPAQDR